MKKTIVLIALVLVPIAIVVIAVVLGPEKPAPGDGVETDAVEKPDLADDGTPGEVLHADDSNFRELVLESDRPVIADFYSNSCPPCRKFAPILKAYAAKHPEIRAVKIDVDTAPRASDQYQIRYIPSIFLFKDGKVANAQTGFMSMTDLEKFVKAGK